jgi:acetyl esterase
VPDRSELDPGLRLLLDQVAAAGSRKVSEMTPDEARAAYRLLSAADGPIEEVGAVEDRECAGVPCRLYRPSGEGGDGTGGAPLPVLAWFHGGGWVIGDLDEADASARRLANRVGCLVVSVDYRLAPEHPFPAAFDDCWSVAAWLAGGGAGDLGADAGRLAVGGNSAGGNLAAAVAVRARDEGIPLRHQLLVCPVTDASSEHPSYAENSDGYLLTADTMRWFVANYVAPEQRTDPRVSPLLVADLAGVAPAHVITAGFDPLRDEGDAYAARLAAAGVDVEHDRVPNGIHDFLLMAAVTPLALEYVDRAAALLAKALA